MRRFFSTSVFIFVFSTLPLSFSCRHASYSVKLYDWENYQKLTDAEQQVAYRVDTFFQHKVKGAGLNACVLVEYKGRMIYNSCFGYQNYGKKKSLTDSSQFQLASVSKPFTATAIFILEERGKLNIDDRVSKYIKGFPYDNITIRMLLDHRSGLANYIYLFDTLKLPADTFITNDDVINYFVKNKPPLQATPDHKFQYCNTNFALLASIVEKVSGESLADFERENIFLPAHMYHTFVREVQHDTIRPNQTFAYTGSKWEKVSDVPYDGVLGDKNVYSTAWDMFLFDEALNHDIILKKETLDDCYKGCSYEHPGQKNYGLGWRLLELPDSVTIVYHNGWWRGYTTSFRRRPDEQTCIVVLCNKFNRSAYDLKPLYGILGMEGEADGGEE